MLWGRTETPDGARSQGPDGWMDALQRLQFLFSPQQFGVELQRCLTRA